MFLQPLSPQKMKREKSCRVHSNNFFPSSSSAKPAAGGRGCATIGSKSPGESIAPPPPHVNVLPPGANSFRRSHRNPRFSYSFGRSNAVACCTGVEPLLLHRKCMQISCSVSMSSRHIRFQSYSVRSLTPCGIASVPRCFLVMLDWLDIQSVADMATFYVWRFQAKTAQFYLT